MDAEVIKLISQGGQSVAVIITVFLFLRFLREEREMRRQEQKEQREQYHELAQAVNSLSGAVREFSGQLQGRIECPMRSKQ